RKLFSIERYWASHSGADRKKRREHRQWPRNIFEPALRISLLLHVVGGQSITDHITGCPAAQILTKAPAFQARKS
ncbi:MAG TPA: hypothetical protein VK491_10495, partial [Gemmatimonadaceae bacterium]|nr:hypothetical protein [Gemmatimonadaceae bacterium]